MLVFDSLDMDLLYSSISSVHSLTYKDLFTLHSNLPCRRSPISIAAAVIYMITQLSEDKKPLKGLKHSPVLSFSPPTLSAE